jgi:hypothetical protein
MLELTDFDQPVWLFGVIWFLQGINLLPGRFMTGQLRWAEQPNKPELL